MSWEDIEKPPQAMSLAKLLCINVCLAIIAVTSYFNAIICFSFTVICAAAIIKICKLDPEPFFLLSLHTLISCLMFHDTPTTLAIIVAVAMVCLTAGSIEVSSERIAVFLVSTALSCMLGQMATVIAAVVLVVAIIALKVRPLRPASNCVLCLLLLAVSIPICSHVTAILSCIMAVGVTTWFIIGRHRNKIDLLHLEHMERHHGINNNNNNDNSRLPLINGGHVKLGNTTDSLDLHGHTVTSALKSLHEYLKEHEDSYRQNRTAQTRFLKVITGEDGKNNPEDSLNLVKPTVANFLKINKYRFQVNPSRPGILKIDLESHII